MLAKVTRFFQAMLRVAKNLVTRRPVLVSEDVADERREMCRTQDDCYDPDSDTCRDCGCFIAGKTLLATEKCPRKKWRR